MAAFRDFYIPSTAEGLTWRVGYHKPERGPGVVSAYEGESEVTPDGVRIFRTVLYQSRGFRHPLNGRATKRAVAQALSELLVHMEASEVISHELAMKWVQKAQSI
jgi:hypothetical protein